MTRIGRAAILVTMRLLAGPLLLLALALPASASAVKYQSSAGEVEHTSGINCASITFGSPYAEPQTFLYATQTVPVKGLIPAGDRFFVGASFGSVGNHCGGGGRILPTFVLPQGVELAADRNWKPFWTLDLDDKTEEGKDPVVLNPAGPYGGISATVRDRRTGERQPWLYADYGGTVSVYVPVRARRTLKGIGSTAPGCPAAEENTGPCAKEQSGDYLQLVGQVADGSFNDLLVPNVGLFAGPPRPPRLRATARAGRLVVRATTAPRFRVRVTVERGGRTLLRRRVTARKSGSARLVARDLPRGRVTVEATAVADDGTPSLKRARRKLILR